MLKLAKYLLKCSESTTIPQNDIGGDLSFSFWDLQKKFMFRLHGESSLLSKHPVQQTPNKYWNKTELFLSPCSPAPTSSWDSRKEWGRTEVAVSQICFLAFFGTLSFQKDNQTPSCWAPDVSLTAFRSSEQESNEFTGMLSD